PLFRAATNPAMVLGSSEVRVIDLTRAFAAVAAGGRSIEPYGITRVVTSGGEVLYRHEAARSHQLVPDYVAAGMTDLLQSAVSTGTGRRRRSDDRWRAKPAPPARTKTAGSWASRAVSPL